VHAGLGDQVSFVIPVNSQESYSEFIVGRGRNLVTFRWDDAHGAMKTLHVVDHGLPTRFNDAKCDSHGRLWAGTMAIDYDVTAVNTVGKGSLYCLETDRTLTKAADNIVLSR
jgi:sugar lactone lactonase YvrE